MLLSAAAIARLSVVAVGGTIHITTASYLCFERLTGSRIVRTLISAKGTLATETQLGENDAWGNVVALACASRRPVVRHDDHDRQHGIQEGSRHENQGGLHIEMLFRLCSGVKSCYYNGGQIMKTGQL
jgi:hypothetical protein